MKNHFTENDQKQLVDFLNFVAMNASFKNKEGAWTTADTITHFRLLQHMQTVILPKVEAHILEVKSVVPAQVPAAAEVKAETKPSKARNSK